MTSIRDLDQALETICDPIAIVLHPRDSLARINPTTFSLDNGRPVPIVTGPDPLRHSYILAVGRDGQPSLHRLGF